MADETPEQPRPPRRSRVGDAADALGDAALNVATAAERASRITPQGAVVIISIILIGFVCVTQTMSQWVDREERKATAKERQDAAMSSVRETNAQNELMRQHCAAEGGALRSFFSEQNDKRMRFEAEERAKDRATFTALTQSFDELRRILKPPKD